MTVDCYTTGRDDICSAADNFCATEVESLLDDIPDRDEYDVRELQPDPFPYDFYVDYLNTPAVQQAIGAFVNFSESSNTVSNAFGTTGDDDRQDSTIEDVRKLVSQGVYVVSYAGDADYNCNWLGGQAVAEEINAAGFSSAGFTNITTSDGVVHGQVKQSGNYAFVRIYESGHEVPFYQPIAALEMFERAIAGKDIADGNCSWIGYKSVGTAQSTYREGNATIQWEVLPTNATYNTTLNGPNPTNSTSSKRSVGVERKKLRRSNRLFKPMPESRRKFAKRSIIDINDSA
jgi:hypothetical protein